MCIFSISSSLSHYPFATSASSAYLIADMNHRIVTGDYNAFIAALENTKVADISIDVEIDSDKNTLLMYALRKGHYHIATHFLEMGADHKITDDCGNKVLILMFSHYATDTDLSEATRKAIDTMIVISSGINDNMLMTLLSLMETSGSNVNLY